MKKAKKCQMMKKNNSSNKIIHKFKKQKSQQYQMKKIHDDNRKNTIFNLKNNLLKQMPFHFIRTESLM